MLYRAEGLLDESLLYKKSVAILGVGSLGSQLVGFLPYRFRLLQLVDPERLEEENVERHALGRSYLRQNKAEGMIRWLRRSFGLPGWMFNRWQRAEDFLDHGVSHLNLLVDCTADPAVNRLSFEAGFQANVPLLYASVYPEGRGGQILVLPEPRRLCRECVRECWPQVEAPPHYGQSARPVAKRWVPALRASVGLIAAWAAEFALSLLMGEQEEPQCFVVTDRRSPVLSFPPGREVEVIEAYLAGQEARGEVVTRRIFEQSGRFTFAQERGTVALRLPEREACERHKSVYSLDEI